MFVRPNPNPFALPPPPSLSSEEQEQSPPKKTNKKSNTIHPDPTITTKKCVQTNPVSALYLLMLRELLHTECRPDLTWSPEKKKSSSSWVGGILGGGVSWIGSGGIGLGGFGGGGGERWMARKEKEMEDGIDDLPWWEPTSKQQGQQIISYNNLMNRLWTKGCSSTETLTIPHPLWIQKLGFQEPNPIHDFRSGGLLSLVLLVHLVESCPQIVSRFQSSILPFGTTSLNVTNMISKLWLLGRNVEKVNALLMVRPFWGICMDPRSVLVMQEVCMEVLADVVVEIDWERGRNRRKRMMKAKKEDEEQGEEGEEGFEDEDDLVEGTEQRQDGVTVFDFPEIMERTELRVRDDILGSGPETVLDLRRLASEFSVKYKRDLEQRMKEEEDEGVNNNSNHGLNGETLVGEEGANNSQLLSSDELDAAGGGCGFSSKIKHEVGATCYSGFMSCDDK